MESVLGQFNLMLCGLLCTLFYMMHLKYSNGGCQLHLDSAQCFHSQFGEVVHERMNEESHIKNSYNTTGVPKLILLQYTQKLCTL